MIQDIKNDDDIEIAVIFPPDRDGKRPLIQASGEIGLVIWAQRDTSDAEHHLVCYTAGEDEEALADMIGIWAENMELEGYDQIRKLLMTRLSKNTVHSDRYIQA